jgi:hypothetical protein
MSKQLTLSFLILLVNMGPNSGLSSNSQPIEDSSLSSIMLATPDSLTFIYPSEMGYEKDYLHIIFKLVNAKLDYRIEEAVFDNKTWSVYLIVSNASGGSDLLRLKRSFGPSSTHSVDLDYGYEIDSVNWSLQLVHRFERSKLLSMDISVAKRRLYLFEFNKTSKKYSIVLVKLTGGHHRLFYFTFAYTSNHFFKNDGYLYVTVARDNFSLNGNGNGLVNASGLVTADITLFISNNQTLNICFLINMTCNDYFRQPIVNK